MVDLRGSCFVTCEARSLAYSWFWATFWAFVAKRDFFLFLFVVFWACFFDKKGHPSAQNVEIDHDFLKTPVPALILKFVWQVPNFTKVVTSRKLWRHKSKLNLPKYRCLAITYPILSDFKETFWIIPSFLPPDQYARGVVVCCKGAVSYLACLFAGLFTYLYACFVGWLVGLLLARLLA